jgi:hypothetical protein
MCLNEFTCRGCEKNFKSPFKVYDGPANIPELTVPNINLGKTVTGLQPVRAMPRICFIQSFQHSAINRCFISQDSMRQGNVGKYMCEYTRTLWR